MFMHQHFISVEIRQASGSRQAVVKLSKIPKICHLLRSLWGWKTFQSWLLLFYRLQQTFQSLVFWISVIKSVHFKKRDPHFFQNHCHFQYNISWLCFDSPEVVLKMTTILKQMWITQLGSWNERTLMLHLLFECYSLTKYWGILKFLKNTIGNWKSYQIRPNIQLECHLQNLRLHFFYHRLFQFHPSSYF